MPRNPLSDVTNKCVSVEDITKYYNLRPIPALRELVASSSSFPKPPLSNSSSTNLRVFSDSSSKSNTSIGSSNVCAILNSKKTVQFRTPSPVIPSVTPSGGIGSKDAAHSRRQITEKSKEEKEANVIVSHAPVEKRKDKEKAIVVPLSSSPSENTKYNQNGSEGIHKEFRNYSHEKTREKGKAVLQPSDIVEIAEHKGPSNVAPTMKSQKRKFDAVASSCPPVMRPKSIENNLNEARDVKSLKSCTDPHLKLRKKTYSRTNKTSKLPQEFVERQKAYFKEIDEFELAEEEVSADELD